MSIPTTTVATLYTQSPFGGTDLRDIYAQIQSKCPAILRRLLTHERPEQELVAKYIQPNSTVLELGGNLGATAMIINEKLSNKKHHVIVEPEKKFVDHLRHQAKTLTHEYTVAHGILASDRAKQVALWPSCQKSKMFSLTELQNLIGGAFFTALVVDCEGAFDPILRDFPEILSHIKVIVVENDGGDLEFIRSRIVAAGLKLVHCQSHPHWDGNLDNFTERFQCFHEVWLRVP